MLKLSIFTMHDYITKGKSFDDFLADTVEEREKLPKVTVKDLKSAFDRVASKCSSQEEWISYLKMTATSSAKYLENTLMALKKEGVDRDEVEAVAELKSFLGD